MWQGKGLFITIGLVEEQQNYYEQWDKKSISKLRIKILDQRSSIQEALLLFKPPCLDIDSYVKSLTQRNCEGLKVM